MKEKVGIVAFAFGLPATIKSNRRIAQIASQKARELSAPIYTQLDVLIEAELNVEYTKEQPGNPPPTLRIARGAVYWAWQKGLTKLWVVPAKPHLWRCVRDLTYAVREARTPIEISVCREIEQFPEDEWFCSDSEQPHTCSKWNWWSREIIVKMIPFFVYKRIAN